MNKQERIQYVFQRPTPYLCQHVQPKKAMNKLLLSLNHLHLIYELLT